MNFFMNYQPKQEQTKQMVMTFGLSQAIYLLQYSTLDLYHHIEDQLVDNPVLEVEDCRGFMECTIKDIELPSSKKMSLEDGLFEQLEEPHLDHRMKEVCRFIINHLDEYGYLHVDFDECSNKGISYEEWNDALEMIQSFDPPGVGARSLKECLLIQLRQKSAPALAKRLVEEYLDDIASGRWNAIFSSTKATYSELKKALKQIRSCHPRPGSAFYQGNTLYIFPDVILRKMDDHYYVFLNDGVLPKLRINSMYEDAKCDPKFRSQIEAWVQSAKWLIKGMDQRRVTLQRVVKAIVDKQKMFINKGISFLSPLTLKEIAHELNIHESTVSRATKNKYIQTPKGTYPLSYFFSGGIPQKEGSWLSSMYVKEKIKERVLYEDKEKPYSDQEILEYLKKEGILISRRTVTKYRELLHIYSSKQRKMY